MGQKTATNGVRSVAGIVAGDAVREDTWKLDPKRDQKKNTNIAGKVGGSVADDVAWKVCSPRGEGRRP